MCKRTLGLWCFNGAARFHARIARRTSRWSRLGSRFNGAARFHARIARSTRRRAMPRSSFNGAARFHARIVDPCQVRLRWGWASTGPRAFTRGLSRIPVSFHPCRKASTGPRAFTRGLQTEAWLRSGRPLGFNGAARFHARIGRSSRCAFAVAWRFNGAARFHARIEGRSMFHVPPKFHVLQRGRALSRADWPTVEGEREAWESLQRGRALSRADCAGLCSSAGSCSGFNGAARFHARIAEPPPESPNPRTASTGPRAFTRGLCRR